MLSSLARYLEPLPDDEGEPFLNQIQALFQSDFIAKQPHEESLNTSPRPVDTEDFAFDQLISHNRPQDAREACDQGSGKAFSDRVQTTMDTTSETNNMPVLHMGSVLSSEHDYLLWLWLSIVLYCCTLIHIIVIVICISIINNSIFFILLYIRNVLQ